MRHWGLIDKVTVEQRLEQVQSAAGGGGGVAGGKEGACVAGAGRARVQLVRTPEATKRALAFIPGEMGKHCWVLSRKEKFLLLS